MPKIVLVGAGSHVFSRRLVTDMLTWPSLREGTITLMDIDPARLDLMTRLSKRIASELGAPARIEATTDLESALQGADYVTVAIRASASNTHVTIPMKYGVDQAVGDTVGPGGVFYFLKNAPAILNIAQAMQRICPNALMLNYTNPMCMLSWAVSKTTSIPYVGLCHSVQGTAEAIAGYAGIPFEEVSYWAAGINHMAWFLKYQWKGQDAYPLIHAAGKKPEVYAKDMVKFEILKYFGAFVSESSVHASEYMPYFRRTPEMVAALSSEVMWGARKPGETMAQRRAGWEERRIATEKEYIAMAAGELPVDTNRSKEFCSFILNAHETNQPYCFNGNVRNTGLITNLPPDCIVEVPILVDRCGLHPCYVGDLPAQLAGLIRSNIAMQELAVQGLLEKDRECIYRAIQLDPLTGSVLTLPRIREMVDEMFAADAAEITI
jgi:alpha-galactosidase